MSLTIYSSNSEFKYEVKAIDEMIVWDADNPFMREGWLLGKLLIEPTKLSLDGYEKGSYWIRKKIDLLDSLDNLIRKIEDDHDLLKYRYQFSFTGEESLKRPSSSGAAGFKVDGYFGSIRSAPRQFLTLQLSELSTSGRGRPVKYIDMRNMNSIETEDWGTLRVHKREYEFTLYSVCQNLQEYLNSCDDTEVKIVPKWQRKN